MSAKNRWTFGFKFHTTFSIAVANVYFSYLSNSKSLLRCFQRSVILSSGSWQWCWAQQFWHIWSIKVISQFSVIISCADSWKIFIISKTNPIIIIHTWYDWYFGRKVFILSYSLSFFHQQQTKTLMLKFWRILHPNRNNSSISIFFSLSNNWSQEQNRILKSGRHRKKWAIRLSTHLDMV